MYLGFNADIASDRYTTWDEALQLLLRQRTPAVFTEFSHYSAQFAANRIDMHRSACDSARGDNGARGDGADDGGRGGTAVTMNPFRSPVRDMLSDGYSNVPSYSNAFIVTMW